MAFLAPEALRLGHGDPRYAYFVQRFLHLIELERLDDRFDLFHACFYSRPRPVASITVPAGDRQEHVPVIGRIAPLPAQFVRSAAIARSEEHTSELQSLMRSSYAVFCLKKKNITKPHTTTTPQFLHNYYSVRLLN